ncbi:tetratricopeptide repeat protein, partial [Brevundimonas sp.]|uniref:tetratricopeptide repeat protein n=1 Tax=Brevundimonas sp. TaxID=1871086 RepID=UPI002ABCB99D
PTTVWLNSTLGFGLGEIGREREALPLIRDVLDRWIAFGWGDTEVTLRTHIYYGFLLTRTNRADEAEVLLAQLLERPDLPPAVRASAMGQRTWALHQLGRFEEALEMGQATLDLVLTVYGPSHTETFTAQGNVAVALGELGRSDEALALLRQSAGAAIAALGPNDPQSLNTLQNLAAELHGSGRSHQAEPLFRDVIARAADPSLRAMAMHHLGLALMALSRPVEAEIELRHAIELREGLSDPIDLAISWSMLALALDQQGRHAEAQPLHARALDIARAANVTWHVESGIVLSQGENLQWLGRLDEAEARLRRAKVLADAHLVEGHPRRLLRDQRLAAVLLDRKRPAEALALMRDASALLLTRTDGREGTDRIDPWNTRGDIFAIVVRAAWDQATLGGSAR